MTHHHNASAHQAVSRCSRDVRDAGSDATIAIGRYERGALLPSMMKMMISDNIVDLVSADHVRTPDHVCLFCVVLFK